MASLRVFRALNMLFWLGGTLSANDNQSMAFTATRRPAIMYVWKEEGNLVRQIKPIKNMKINQATTEKTIFLLYTHTELPVNEVHLANTIVQYCNKSQLHTCWYSMCLEAIWEFDRRKKLNSRSLSFWMNFCLLTRSKVKRNTCVLGRCW